MSRRQLMRALCEGHPIDPAALDDSMYKGVSLGLPGFIDKLAWKTFEKVFLRDRETGVLRGWNVRVEQRGVDAACVPQLKDGKPLAFGHYEVVPARGRRLPKPCDQGLLIDYSLGGRRRLSFGARLRDPIVAVNAGSEELLLGWSYLDFGFVRIGTPSFFTLERIGPLDHRADPQ